MFRKRIFPLLLLLSAALCSQHVLYAQNQDALTSFTPYSMFGVGDLTSPGTSFNRGMGGIGVGVRDNRYINYLNPAAASAHDTLSFMMDIGLLQNNIYSADATRTSAYNVFNIHHIMLSFPVYKKSAMQLGIVPYSNVGYTFSDKENRDEIIGTIADFRYVYYGQGSINQAFAAFSATFFKHLSVGIQGMYYFGNLERKSVATPVTSSSVYGALSTGYDVVINSFGAQAGLQFSAFLAPQTLLTLGGTYQLASNLKGESNRYAKMESSSSIDTIYSNVTDNALLSIPSEWTVGFSIRKTDKWMFGVDYQQSDWTNAKYTATPGVNFATAMSRKVKVGVEFIPDRYNIRYYMRRWTYRLGGYYEKSHMMLNGQPITATGVTLGFSVPVNRWYNSIGVSLDLGQRGSIENNLVRERYAMLILDFNLHDIWFLKHRYE